ncbi:hypothetical protein KP509_35G044800 [Ceratopteris richardii]|nr:hypothetical protein KP509_35G044800 [Ceratopteris richardii]
MTEGGLIFYENSASQALPYFALGYPLVLTTPETLLNSPCNHTRLDVTELNMTQVQTVPSPSCKLSSPSMPISVSFESSIVFIRLETNGILKGYYPDHKPAYDVLRNVRDGNVTKGTCRIPNACGPYGICENSQCRCPGDNNSSISTLFNNSSTKEYLLTSTLCNLKVPVTCNHSGDVEQQYLVDVGSVDYFANDLIEPTMLAGSFDECKQACQRNCTCQASFYRRKSKHCYLHESVLSMIQMNDGGYMGAIKVQRSKENSRNLGVGLIASICIVTALLLIAVIGTYFFFYHRKRWRGGMKAGLDKDDVELLASLPGQPRRFSYKELQDATWDFSQKLGAGGFGSVYKGVFSDGSIVAVKKLENTAKFTQGMKEFRNEVITLSNINHQNLVHLKGFCADGGHRLLVYEYVSNGSLDSWLFLRGEHHGRTLDWKTRLSIAVQTARGLSFLHEQCRNRIVHLDIKPQNILLDDNFSPKLSDFGLSQLINEDQDSAVTRMRGTPGYMAPECLVLTDATEKSDVYSFGMVLLEIVSGRKNVDISRLTVHGDEEGWYFPALASRKFKDGKALDIVDKNIMPLQNEEVAEVTRVLKTAFWCIQDNPSLRPSMGKVVLILEGYSNVAQPPLSFSFGKRFHLSNTISTNPQSPIDGSPRHNTFDKPEHAQGNGNHHDEAQWKEKKDDNGEPEGVMYHSSHVQSLHSSAHSSHHASPRASPLPTLLSHNSLPHSAFRQASPCQSPSSNAASTPILTSQRISPVHLSPVSSPH